MNKRFSVFIAANGGLGREVSLEGKNRARAGINKSQQQTKADRWKCAKEGIGQQKHKENKW